MPLMLAAGTLVQAATLEVDISLPPSASAAYHFPYLAVWVEKADQPTLAATLAVWYDQRLRDGLGKVFLKDLRTWWRKGGQAMHLPADGISGATRGPGTHVLHVEGSAALAQLPAGHYVLAVEAAREQGGRSVLRTPFEWGAGSSDSRADAQDGELLAIRARVRP